MPGTAEIKVSVTDVEPVVSLIAATTELVAALTANRETVGRLPEPALQPLSRVQGLLRGLGIERR